MADAFTGEIRIFSGNYAPRDWALCNGQLLKITDYTTLYSIIGFQYGGDGKTTFALPNLMGSAVLHQGQGVGLTHHIIGSKTGSAQVTLVLSQTPNHTHTAQAVAVNGNQNSPTDSYWAQAPKPAPTLPQPLLYNSTPAAQMSPMTLGAVGGSQPHNNMQPFIAQNFIICLNGDYYPVRP